MSDGQGSISYSNPPGGGSGGIVVAGARNGLTVDAGKYIVLGQDVGASGNPGELLSIREIIINGYGINFPTAGDGYIHITSSQQSMAFYRGNSGLQPITIFTKQGLNPAPGSTYGNFMIGWLDESYTNPDGQIDACMSIGYNTDGGDGSLNPDEASFATVLESSYQQGGVGNPDFEWYLQTASRTGIKNRHLFLVVDKITGEANLDASIEQLELQTTDGAPNPNQVYFIVNGGGECTIVGPTAFLEVTTQTPSTDGGIKIQPIVGSNGTTQIQNLNGNGLLQFLSATQFYTGTFALGFSNYIFSSISAAGPTRLLSCINNNFDPNEAIFQVRNNGNMILYKGAKFGDNGANNDPTAQVNTSPGTAAAGDGQLKLSVDTALKTVPEDGLFEYDGTHLYFTIGSTRHTIV